MSQRATQEREFLHNLFKNANAQLYAFLKMEVCATGSDCSNSRCLALGWFVTLRGFECICYVALPLKGTSFLNEIVSYCPVKFRKACRIRASISWVINFRGHSSDLPSYGRHGESGVWPGKESESDKHWVPGGSA